MTDTLVLFLSCISGLLALCFALSELASVGVERVGFDVWRTK